MLCVLFRFSLASRYLFLSYENTDDEMPVVVRTRFRNGLIGRRDAFLILRRFLEAALCVLIRALLDDLAQFGKEMLCDKCFRRFVSLIQVDGAKDRLEGVREDDFTRSPRILRLALREQKQVVDAELARHLCKRNGVHQSRAVCRQISLRLVGIGLEKESSRGELEDGIPKKLKSLVVGFRALILVEV